MTSSGMRDQTARPWRNTTRTPRVVNAIVIRYHPAGLGLPVQAAEGAGIRLPFLWRAGLAGHTTHAVIS